RSIVFSCVMFKEIVCIIKSQIKFSTGQPFYYGRVAMIKEGTDFLIKGLNSLHVLIRKLKIEDIEVLFHPFLTNRFWNRNNTSLCEPSQYNLRCGLIIFFSNGSQ